ncbi:transposase family protein, partial [Streptomyces sp. NPDC056728]
MTKKWARAALSHPAFTGVSRAHLGSLIEELAGPWQARRESALHQRWGGKRHRAAGAGRKHELVFTDRVLVALAHLRTQLPHAALAELYGVGRSTVTEAIGKIRPLLADRGFAVPDQPGLRLRTLADVFAYADAEGRDLADRRDRDPGPPPEGPPAGPLCVRLRQEDAEHHAMARAAPCGPGPTGPEECTIRPRCARRASPSSSASTRVDEGYRGLANEFPEQVSAPPKKPKEDAPLGDHYAWHAQRRRQSSARICVEHANAEHKQRRPLQRFLGRREH